MAINYNPRTVTNGLVLCLDAGNTKSYPGTGATWTDISRNGNTGSLINMDGANLDSANGGILTFDGTNEEVNCGNDASINFGTGNFTISVWFKRSSSPTTNLRVLSKGAGSDSANEANAGFSLFGSDIGMSFAINPTGTRTIITAAGYSVNEWVNVVGILERGVSMRGYKNASLINSFSAPSGSISGTSPLIIGSNVGVSSWWTGAIANVSLYNRALTAAEIQQNFNALRGRFGI